MMRRPRYIIYARDYDPVSGGLVVLHKLAQMLADMGESVALRPAFTAKTGRRLAPLRELWYGYHYTSAPDSRVPVTWRPYASRNDIVIYPEVVAGNPLRARNVVRWLLHRPGFHTGVIEYGAGDMMVKFDEFCDDPAITGGSIPQLFLFTINPAYVDQGRTDRSGICYLIRKGGGRPLIHADPDALRLDGLPHEKVVAAFNKCSRFYSYDEATMYSVFAALCGCISIVVPLERYPTREAWAEKHPLLQYGVAYGEDDIPRALATRGLMKDHLGALEQKGLDSVRAFIRLSRKRFDFAPLSA